MSAKKSEDLIRADKTVDASPTKGFFVDMLVRDIALVDAVLDLLDNCVDGILRLHKGDAAGDLPYNRFWAHINFDGKSFRILDNCGGISKRIALDYAFRMGNPDPSRDRNIPTVGMYGIGMKRAFFKMGRSIRVRSQHRKDCYEIAITPRWLDDDDDWDLPLEDVARHFDEDGTEIFVKDLNDTIKKEFGSVGSSFEANLERAISHYYSLIIQKGFEVKVNGEQVKSKPIELLLDTESTSPKKPKIAPFLYHGTRDGVKVDLAVGLYRAPLGMDKQEDESKMKRSKSTAGWTVICNDRVVAYCDRTELTGWGTSDVPAFHNQFNAISGVVHFRCNDSWKLPVTTTKRGVDANSKLYLYVRGFMMEGTKKFTSYTNRWKSHVQIEREISDSATPINIGELASKVPIKQWKRVKGLSSERKFDPVLPAPDKIKEHAQMMFYRRIKDVRLVSEYLFKKPDKSPSNVASACFDKVLKEAKK